jgi:hypothetical protein
MDIEDILQLYRTADPPPVPGQLSAEHRAILEGESIDRKEFDFHIANGDFSKAFACQAESGSLHKSADFIEADEILRDFQNHHDKKSLAEQLAPLIARACEKLSREHGELLRKALAAFDLSIVTYFLGKAFA